VSDITKSLNDGGILTYWENYLNLGHIFLL